MMYQYGMSESRSASFPVEKTRHLLDDSFLESQSPMRNDPRSTSVSNGLTLGKRNTQVYTFLIILIIIVLSKQKISITIFFSA